MTEHSTGTREEWRSARVELLELKRSTPDWPTSSPACAASSPGANRHAYKERMGWDFTWVSSLKSDFNFDFGVSYTDEQRASGAEYNFRREEDPGDEGHGLSSFALEDGAVNHVYSTYARGTDVFNTFYQLLERAPKGRDEDALLRSEGEWWWRRHDEYDLKEDKPR
jgi:predicted dithiol-disulfide oxidoreductase (DUF899 family)